ncbi:hypothetical protein FZO89_03805 [Luteimonas viscosa]|uniref:Uncharacterized protein n=1 Tax=Luteimonas viscosa TaxID=1132694 RepID=A0A5D4XNC5_9GAMM|nr:hypothetical protein [Luteimonas viscosa]TYT25455.1 hypothetical protein FZO89_03805 [Luteimonas viscosa]
MKLMRWLVVAALVLPFHVFAQSTSRCPELPAGADLVWETIEGGDFLYCKAMHADGAQAFAVMLRAESPFRERFSLREESGTIGGHEVRWYRGVLALDDAIVRETLIELDDDLTAHITLRVDTEQELAESLRLAEGLRFHDSRIGSN